MSSLDSVRGRPTIPARREPRWVAWRREQLARAGFDDALAVRLAATGDVDLHAVLDLVGHECPPRVAARLLSSSTPRPPRVVG